MLDAPHALLACFGAFYDRVAAVKQAAAGGRLESLLAEPGVAPPASGAELAARVHAGLLGFLEHQQREVAAHATGGQLKAYRAVLKLMAVVADEALLLDLTWAGRGPWFDMLLETRLFHSRDGGSWVFELADRLIGAGGRNAVERDVAAVLLFALQLGFRGRLRGAGAASELQRYRSALARLAGDAVPAARHGFPQAYAHGARGAGPDPHAPLAPWLRAASAACAACLALSALCWYWTMAGLLPRLAFTS